VQKKGEDTNTNTDGIEKN